MTIELIPNSTFRIVILWVCVSTFTLNLNHVSLAVENTNKEEEYNVINELVVNNKNQYKTVIYENENEGISEMRKLIESSQIEESWVYLPHQEKWIEIGYNEESEKKINESYITKAKLDIKFLDGLMNENNNMILYHFHSSYCLSLEDKIKEREKDGSPMNENEIEKERIRLLIKSAYPSRSDLLNMIGNSTEFFKRNSDGNITFKVCSHYGITEYRLTDEGMEYLYADNSLKQILRITGISSSANIEANVKGEILEMNPRETRDPLKRIKMSPKQKRSSLSRYKIIDPLSRIEKVVEEMNDEHLRVTFTPYEKKE
jgi:predicted DNA-binding protein with PD1-like motif